VSTRPRQGNPGVARFAPFAGVVFVVLAVVAVLGLGGDTPDIDSSPQDVAAFFSTHSGREEGAAFLLSLAIVFLVIFGACLHAALRPPEGGSDRWSIVAFGGALVAAAGFLGAAGVRLAIAEAADKQVPPAAVQALNALDNAAFLSFASGLGIMLLGAAGAMIGRTGMMRGLGWLALVIGIVVFTPLGELGFFASGIWIILASFALYFTPPTERRPA
jgi:hypothetical protein